MNPEKIGRYEIKVELGRGGMATVYRAYDPRFDRDVAIKVLPRQFLHDPTFRARFQREARTIAALEHAAIVPVYDFGEEAGQPYLVMRYMSGGSLQQRIERRPLSINEAAAILHRIGSALDHAHSHGVIHRDLKPGNILFDQYGEAFLADFGIVKLTEATASFTGSAIIGTPAYMSPEQARGETVLDGRSDIYAVGAILFETLTGQLPYQADTPMGLAVKHITDPVPRILDVNPNLPPDCELIISRAMAKDRDGRFTTASEMAAAMTMIARGETPSLAAITPETSITPTRLDSESVPLPRRAATFPLAEELEKKEEVPPLSRLKSLPRWVWLAGGLALLLLVAGICLLPGLMGGAAKEPTPTTLIIATQAATATPTTTPTAMPSETPQPSQTHTPKPTPTTTQTPTLTATPEQTKVIETACIDDVELVEVRDPFSYWYVNSRPSFELVLRNNGTCPWPENTRLMLISENTLGWQQSWLIGSAEVGQSKEVKIELTAPGTPQTLHIVWQLEGPGEQILGSEISYDLRVGLRPTRTPYGGGVLLPHQLAGESPTQAVSSQAHLLSAAATTLSFIALAIVRFKAIKHRTHDLSRRWRMWRPTAGC